MSTNNRLSNRPPNTINNRCPIQSCPPVKKSVATGVVVLLIVSIIILAILLIITFISLQNSINTQNKNVCPALPSSAGTTPVPACCATLTDCPSNSTVTYTSCNAKGFCTA